MTVRSVDESSKRPALNVSSSADERTQPRSSFGSATRGSFPMSPCKTTCDGYGTMCRDGCAAGCCPRVGRSRRTASSRNCRVGGVFLAGKTPLISTASSPGRWRPPNGGIWAWVPSFTEHRAAIHFQLADSRIVFSTTALMSICKSASPTLPPLGILRVGSPNDRCLTRGQVAGY